MLLTIGVSVVAGNIGYFRAKKQTPGSLGQHSDIPTVPTALIDYRLSRPMTNDCDTPSLWLNTLK